MQIEQTIKDRLTAAFQPVSLQVINDSHRHAGHASSPGTGESHFSVRVVASAFAGKSRVERHRMVNEALADLLQGKVHALAIQALAPGELR
jgi:BolA protein